ncbi:uncharacterized protein LOC143236317 [Tachypleus tridentatus]|uniref:uncharacterized protein LOC143236317 n=1 Tax=Tachypleus tridentatus TaxID=6853 RepID=UPI003FD0106E
MLNGVTPSVIPRSYNFLLVDRPFHLLIPGLNERWSGLLGGALYKYRLTAEPMDGGESGYADVIIETNSPPIKGGLEVEPPYGNALTTNFTLDASPGWRDSPQDYSLTYTFYYLLNNNDINTPISSATGAPPTVENVVLPGAPNQTTNVIVRLKVCDTWNSCTTTERTVSTEPSPSFSLFDFEHLNKTVHQYLNRGDQVRALSIARAVAVTLNNDKNSDLADQSNTLFQDVIDSMIGSFLIGLEVGPTSSVLTTDILSLLSITQLTIQPGSLRDVTQKNLADLASSLVDTLAGSPLIGSGPMRRLLTSRTKRQTLTHVLPISPEVVSFTSSLNEYFV